MNCRAQLPCPPASRCSAEGSNASVLHSSTMGEKLPGLVFFGYDTALQIYRTLSLRTPIEARSRRRSVPEKTPRKKDVLDALSRLEGADPRIGLSSPAHVLVGGRSHTGSSEQFVTHMCSLEYSNKSFIRLEGLWIASPELAFVQMATLLSDARLIELGFEMCGTYWINRENGAALYQVAPITSTRALMSYARRNSHLNGAGKAMRALRYVVDGSASPRETKLAVTLTLPPRLGGYGLDGLVMNYEIACSSEARTISRRKSLRCDLGWPEFKLDVEYQSREEHEGEESRIRDSMRTNALGVMGWHVTNVTNGEFNDFETIDRIALGLRGMMKRVAVPSAANYHQRKLRLRRELGLPLNPTELYDLACGL